MVLGPGPSGLTLAIEAMPDKEAKIVANRQQGQTANMRRCIEGIKALVETGDGDVDNRNGDPA